MAYSAQTAHYGLPLPVGSDRSSFLDTNESFSAVDTALYNAVTQNAQTEQEVQDLNAEIVTLQSTVEGYAGDIAGLQNGLASTNLLVQEHASDIANLEGAVSNLVTTKQNVTDENLVTTDKTIVGAINELAGATPTVVNNLATEYDATATYAVGDHVMHEDVYYVCSTAISVAEAWDATHWTQRKVGDEIEELSGTKPKLLWTNPDPTQSMSATVISDIQSLNNYDYIEVYAVYSTNAQVGVPMPYAKILKGQTGILCLHSETNGTLMGTRQITFDGLNNRISIANSIDLTGGDKPLWCIVDKIYGGKYSN